MFYFLIAAEVNILQIRIHHFKALINSVPDPKLIISDPDPNPQTENQEFRILL